MKNIKKIVPLLICFLFIVLMFSGCAQSEKLVKSIDEKTMIIAYTEENAPFIYTDENGELTGFDVELIGNIFDTVKGDYSTYAFVKVDKDYTLNEDICYTDDEQNEYSANIMCGGTQKNIGTINEDVNWSVNIIENNIITIVSENSKIANYNDLAGKKVAVASEIAMNALNTNMAIKKNLASAELYSSVDDALSALEKGAVDAVVAEDFDFYNYKGNESFTVLAGALDTIEYALQFAPKKDYSSSFNEAIKEMLSEDYNDGDTLTPLVEKYFGYSGACVFDYKTAGDK